MPKVDMKAEFDNLSPSQQYYVKKLNRLNQTSYEANQKMRKGGRRTGLFLTGVACGIYVYTMYAMKQEKFLDEDFNTVADLSKK